MILEEDVICKDCGASIVYCKCIPLMDKQTLRIIDEIEGILDREPFIGE